jgi:hypothetical protein
LTELSVEDEVWFVTSGTPADQPGVTLHKVGERSMARRFDDVKADWERMVGKVVTLADSTDAVSPLSNLKLTELTIELGFTATGKLAFIAEAGVAASITLTFSRLAPQLPRSSNEDRSGQVGRAGDVDRSG